jgi:hypothetical protein
MEQFFCTRPGVQHFCEFFARSGIIPGLSCRLGYPHKLLSALILLRLRNAKRLWKLACAPIPTQPRSNLQEELRVMRFRVILSLVTMAMACFTLAVWTSSVPEQSRQLLPGDESDHRDFA